MKAVKKISIVDSIAEQLMEAIRIKQFAPGEKIPPERELTVILGVSRTALREAIKRLESIGLLSVRQGNGTYVNDNADEKERAFRHEMNALFSIGDINIRDLVEARILLETKAVALAAERRSNEDLEHLEEIQGHMEQTLDNRGEFLRYDMDFHKYIIRISQNPVLLRFALSIEDLLLEQTIRSVMTNENLQDALQAHMDITKEIKAQNPQKAEETLKKHLEKIPTRLISGTINLNCPSRSL